MSVIQKIRDKYARISVIAIALALMGFILTDYVTGRNRGGYGGGSKNIVGRVNGQKIDRIDFEKKVKQQEDFQKQQGYSRGGEADRQQATQAVWEQEISRILMTEEIDKLGMQVGKREFGDILYGDNAPADIIKQFTDPKTGQFNPAQAKQAVDQMLKKGTQDQKDNFKNFLNQLAVQRMAEKYNSLLTNGTNYPRWILEKQNADNSQLGKLSMIREVYSSIPDSSVKISDQEIADFVSKHKEDYKQEEGRSIAYVSFSASASAADSADAKNKAAALITQLDTTKNVQQLLASEGINNYYDGYINGKTIQIAVKDSIFKTPAGRVYGPYLDGGNYTLAKMIGSRPFPDTVKVRHILIATEQQDQQSGQTVSVRDTITAKKLVDSIQTAIQDGSNFDTLCVKFSDDPGKTDRNTGKYTGGIYDNVYSGQMVSAFNDFIFGNAVGTKGVVKTEFGFHYIEVLSQKGNGLGYKIAYFPKQIIASTETDNNASNQANLFAGDSRDLKTFDANYEKNLKPKGIIRNVRTDIAPTSFEVPGLGFSRTFIRNIYAAKQGQVLQPERINDNYVVAVVTEIYEEGTKGIAKARLEVEPLLRKKKKAALIKQKIGKISTLEAAASVLGKQIEIVDSLRMTQRATSSILAYEPRVSGAVFNPANKGKVVPEVIEGKEGIYVIRVDNITATSIANANVAEQRKMLYQQGKQTAMYNTPVKALRNAATIKDKRAEVF